MRIGPSLSWLVVVLSCAPAARADPPRRALPALPSPGALTLSVELWRASGDSVETGAFATVAISFERLSSARQKVELRPPPALAAPSAQVELPRVDVDAGLPSLRASEVSRALRAAWRVADLDVDDGRLDGLARRARSTAALPELRLRAGRTVDRSMRVSSDEDGSSQQSTGGVGSYYEVRATFRLDRALFADEEVAVARLRRERAEERRKLTRDVLDTVQALLRALARAKDPSASTEEHLDAEARAAAAALSLDALTDGAWSEVWSAAEARARGRSAPAAPPRELESRRWPSRRFRPRWAGWPTRRRSSVSTAASST